jgi:uncharacterized membrane protein YdjX (TVP38/TMEM64 family)
VNSPEPTEGPGGGHPPSSAKDDSASGVPWKPVIVFGVLLLAFVIVYCSPLKAWLQQAWEFKRQLHSLGLVGRLYFTGIVCVLVALGIPRLIFCPIGGMAFGFVQGLWWTQLATMMGYYLIFLFVRWGGRAWVLRHYPKIGNIHEAFGTHPIVAVILIRQLPISGLLINLFLGVSHIRHRHFLAGTLVGILPEAIPLTLVGSGVGKNDPTLSLAFTIAAVAALVLLCLGSWLTRRFSHFYALLREEMKPIEKE